MRCQVRFFHRGSGAVTDCVTQNISSTGFYCSSPTAFTVGESLSCLLKMPSHDASAAASPFTLECVVRVVRVEEPDPEGSFGIACQIEDYRSHSAG